LIDTLTYTRSTVTQRGTECVDFVNKLAVHIIYRSIKSNKKSQQHRLHKARGARAPTFTNG